MAETASRYSLKLVLVGNPSVGKTSLRRRYLGLSFEKQYLSTLGFDMSVKRYQKHRQDAMVTIWDIGGQDYYFAFRQNYYRNLNGAILVFDVTQPLDYEKNLKKWIHEMEEYSFLTSVPVAIIANKIDLRKERVVSEGQIKEAIDKLRTDFPEWEFHDYQTSARKGDNVEDAFSWLIETVLAKIVGGTIL